MSVAENLRNCSKCGAMHGRGGRYCLKCHAAYMREWRKTHPLSVGQHRRDIARSIAGVYRKRGALIPQVCVACAFPEAEMHHIDHERPLEVTWLCRSCHLEWHRFWRDCVIRLFGQWLEGARADISRETSRAA